MACPRLVLVAALAAVACSSAIDDETDETDAPTVEVCDDTSDNDGDGDIDCGDPDCRDDDVCIEKGYFEPKYVAIESSFGWDADLKQIISVTGRNSAGAEVLLRPTVLVSLYSEDERASCLVVYTSVAETLDAQSWSGDNRFGGATTRIDHTGFSLDTIREASTFETDCENLHPADWGDDLEATLGAFVFGGGVGNVHADVEPGLQQIADDSAIDVGVLFGAGWFVSATGGSVAEGQYFAANFGVGFAIDAEQKLIVDGDGNTTFLLADDVVNETGEPPTGYYRSIPAFLFDPVFLHDAR